VSAQCLSSLICFALPQTHSTCQTSIVLGMRSTNKLPSRSEHIDRKITDTLFPSPHPDFQDCRLRQTRYCKRCIIFTNLTIPGSDLQCGRFKTRFQVPDTLTCFQAISIGISLNAIRKPCQTFESQSFYHLRKALDHDGVLTGLQKSLTPLDDSKTRSRCTCLAALSCAFPCVERSRFRVDLQGNFQMDVIPR
jgi:hypothetical protein